MTGSTEIIVEPGRQDIVITRVFDAPREKVFAALTDPRLVAQWWGAGGPGELEISEFDARRGGTYRNISRDEEGVEYAFRGVFHEVLAPERLVHTFEYEGMPGHVALECTDLEQLEDGRTRYTELSVYQSIEDRDGMVASGMEHGARAGLEKLAELVESS
ncbi:SRPBCC family protein [Streptomonospora wellingtoniae]|uniref:SRPBCC family protein n=1 Tax=Streptomonospora wellingtoniae TaxID=3075544 RepID=A0ABU2KSD7_9ACTN|nr:SRPBCC family protein [Streptomonospora sp. DSM 45055]MDT0302018.1 SRPBCC family protein [Streptomonospora sp. DSM 45055]